MPSASSARTRWPSSSTRLALRLAAEGGWRGTAVGAARRPLAATCSAARRSDVAGGLPLDRLLATSPVAVLVRDA